MEDPVKGYVLFAFGFAGTLLERSGDIYQVDIFAYVLMTNHFHLLVKTPLANLQEFMRHFNISYTSYFNRTHHKTGHLYQGRYKSFLIDADSYLQEVSRYIHLNPVRVKEKTKLTVDEKKRYLKQYRWSSYRAYGYGKKNVLVDEYPVYFQLSEDEGERRRKYRQFVRGMLKEKDAMKGEMDRRVVYGGKDFVKEMTKTYKITEKIKRMGRQRGWRKNKENRPF